MRFARIIRRARNATNDGGHLQSRRQMRAGEILEAGVYAGDLDTAERFYSAVLGLEVIAHVEERSAACASATDARPG